MDLDAADVGVRLGDRPVVQNVTLRAASNEIVGIIGPNGAGKTTLLRRLAALLEGSGTVSYGATPAHALSPREQARRRAYVPQLMPAALPYTVGALIGTGCAHQSPVFSTTVARSRIIDSLAAVGCRVDSDAPFSQLSGGEKQQVLLARMVLQNAPIALLDEPTAHLDLRHRANVARVLRSRAAAGSAVVVVLHDLNLASRLCHRLVLLHRGQVAAFGAPSEVLRAAVLEPVFDVALCTVAHPHHASPLVDLADI